MIKAEVELWRLLDLKLNRITPFDYLQFYVEILNTFVCTLSEEQKENLVDDSIVESTKLIGVYLPRYCALLALRQSLLYSFEWPNVLKKL